MRSTGIFELASQRAEWLTARQMTIAENIALANTPGYIAKDIVPFKELVGTAVKGLTLTNPFHLQASNKAAGVKVATSDLASEKAVNVETELMKSVEVRSDYELSAAITKSFHRMIIASAKG